MDFVRLGLERSSSAKEAYYDNSFLIMDKNELYILETVGKNYAIKKEKIATISNCLSISNADFYSDVKDFKNKNSGICMHGEYETTNSMVVLLKDKPEIYFTGCSNPCKSKYIKYIFGEKLVYPIVNEENQDNCYFWKSMRYNNYGIVVNKNRKYNPDEFKNFKYTKITSTDGRDIFIEEITNIQFNNLKSEIKKYGINIGIKHALRDENEQSNLYKQFCDKYGKDYADKIVSPVGTSEHHTGLAIDVEIMINGKWITNNEHIEITEPILKKIHPIFLNMALY